MSTSYIPATDSGLDTWGANFATVLTASPSAYGLTPSDAAAVTAAQSAFHAAYLLATNPPTRTSGTVAAKDVQKAQSLITFRSYAQIIQNNAGVTNDAKSAAGITVRSTARTPIPTPGTIPILGFIGTQPGVATLNFKDSSTPTTKAKPFGALQMQVFAQVNGTASPDRTLAVIAATVTKSPFVLDTPTGGVGKNVTLWANWITRRGLVGSDSTPLTYTGT